MVYPSTRPSTRCSSIDVPSVDTTSACVSPLVNRAEPCVRGRKLTLHVIGLMSLRPLPSNLLCSLIICSCTASSTSTPKTSLILLSLSSSSVSAQHSSINLVRNSFNAFLRSIFPGTTDCTLMSSYTFAFISSRSAVSTVGASCFCFSFPHSTTSSFCIFTIFFISSKPNIIASTNLSSETSFPEASTIITASSVPETTRFIILDSSSEFLGLITNSSSIRPTRTEPVGPSNGMLDTATAAEAPTMEITSGSVSLSADNTADIIWISFEYPFGKRGRIGLSVILIVNISLLVGLLSRLKNPPGNLPTE